MRRRYLLKNDRGEVIETADELFHRVAKAVAAIDSDYGADPGRAELEFLGALRERRFLPNSPTLMNAGTEIGQLSACFVLPVEDSMEGIFEALKKMAHIHKSGGGTGFSFSRLRPGGDLVKTTTGVASGPVSFMKIFDAATDVVKQGGRRRGANMGVLRADHPDIIDFVKAKRDGDVLRNFNLSVAITDAFMDAVAQDKAYWLLNPRTGERVREEQARDVFGLIVESAWLMGDPGLIFIDEINRAHPLAALGPIESTNPCGELPLLPYESCNLGSINLAAVAGQGEIDWDELRRLVRLGVHFLDNVIDASHFPDPLIAELTRANRKIGLGVMGFAELLILLGVSYTSEEALAIADKLGAFIREAARKRSVELAAERGSFPNFSLSDWPKRGLGAIRNATLTTIAPTGTISIIAGTSSGIEPLFAISYIREAMGGVELLETNRIFAEMAQEQGILTESLREAISRSGSIQELDEIPVELRRLFPTTFDIAGEWHVKIQAAWQRNIDNAVSKTVNLPAGATTDDISRIYREAYELKCKGITVYRDGSRPGQVLQVADGRTSEKPRVRAKLEYGGECAIGECSF